jgi:hypothetical protein
MNNQFENPQNIISPLQYAEQLGDANSLTEFNQMYDPKFNHNLAFYLSEGTLNRIGADLTQLIALDDTARQRWLRVIIDGLDYLGIGADPYNKTRGGYSSRSTDIYASTLMKNVLHSTAELFSSLFPASGFIETEVLGIITEQQENHAARIKDFMNYMTTFVMDDYKSDKRQGLFWMILEGSVFSKPYICPIKNIPVAPYVRASDVIISVGASSINDAERITHVFSLSEREVQDRFAAKEWLEVQLESENVNSNLVQNKVNQKMGYQEQLDDKSKRYTFYETITYLDIDGFEHMNVNGSPSGKKIPYKVIKDKNSDKIVALHRYYNENDLTFKPKTFLIQHKYFTGFDIHGFGLIHLCLGLARAETEIQQELIKAAKLSNAPSLLMDSGLRNEKTQIDIKPGSLNQFQTFGSNIQNALMPVPFKEPSQVFLQLMQIISQAQDDYASTFELKPENMPANMSATAMLGILNSMHVLENALINSLYDSFQKEFQFIYDLIGEWLPKEGYPFLLPGSEGLMMKSDFDINISIKPVLDPNLSSRGQKLIVGEALLNLATQSPALYDTKEVHRRLLTTMQISDIDKLFIPDPKDNPPPPPPEMDPLSENKTVMEGSPIKPYKMQDHKSHIIIHNSLIATLSADQDNDQTALIAELKSHIQAHKTLEYIAQMEMMTGITLPDDPSQIPPEIQNQIAVQTAQKLQQEKQQEEAANPPPPDPNQVMMEDIRVKEKAIDAKTHETQSRLQLEEMKLSKESETESLKLQIQLKELELSEKELMIQEKKLMITETEINLKNQIELEKIRSENNKTDLTVQSKAFDSTLDYQSKQEVNQAKIVSDEEKNSLDAQTQAFKSTLDFEKNKEKEQLNADYSTQIGQ